MLETPVSWHRSGAGINHIHWSGRSDYIPERAIDWLASACMDGYTPGLVTYMGWETLFETQPFNDHIELDKKR